ncbi:MULTISPECIES: TDP-N-acetylfucosamine:lipid II N-acetylfucosaminyltransferase [Actinosynnema]|uniref:TDP-N-acetylfucosamine:lipid II N-acetylfucosaminyltransferase n=1 Tax=Actinosynnema TaxID=40566 RepID=UPI0020A4BF2B|nr:TDP-N-acetylfucosamine:lipid II N-acetylfucosaminyltransferase [Actinosynnema pretiosum]MCP2098815.1 antigen polymerase [Actinosynnema pretiosum]
MIHLLGSDIPHHNSTVLRFFDRVVARTSPSRPVFWVTAADPHALGEHPNLDVTVFPTRRALARSAVTAALRDRSRRFFLHGQFAPELWLALLGGAIRPDQVDWHVWGADLHETAEGPRARAFYRMRRAAHGRVGRVHGTLGDLAHYRARHPDVPASLLYFPTRMPETPVAPTVPGPGFTVLVGNSGDRSNRHVLALRAVRSRFGPDTRVVIPFGHPPGNDDYRRTVTAEARRLFRPDAVRLLPEPLPLDDYAALVAGCDLGYLLAPRQQGIGTLSLLIRHGVPFVLSERNTFAVDLAEQGVPFLRHGEDVGAEAVRRCRDRLAHVRWSALSFTPENCAPAWHALTLTAPAPTAPPPTAPATVVGSFVTPLAHLLRALLPADRLSFDTCFSLAFALTSYLGVPLTLLLVLGFGAEGVPAGPAVGALLLPVAFYLAYRASYATTRPTGAPRPLPALTHRESTTTAAAMAALACGSLAAFTARNGVLLLRAANYAQALSPGVRAVALKRFPHFFLPAALIAYFQRPTRRRWLAFLATTSAFGALTYAAVGGTRATFVMALALSTVLGLADGHLPQWTVVPLGAGGVVVLHLLAQGRYRLGSTGWQRLHDFLVFTRDTLSPWEHLALILRKRATVDFQGLAPIIRDFHVYVPRRLWPTRPRITLNTAKYFTLHVLGAERVTTLSPTLVGSSYLMGGVPGVLLGAGATGLVVGGLDRLLRAAGPDDAVVKAFCLGSLFTVAVLVREGLDSFTSRFALHTGVFGVGVATAKAVRALLPDRTPQGGPEMSAVTRHELRGVGVLGYRDRQHLLDDLFDGGTPRAGLVVAINAEKVVVSERDPELRRVVQEAEFPYADGVSIVRSLRRKFGVRVERVPGVELWPALMRRAGEVGAGVFLLGGRPEVLDAVRRKVSEEWRVDVVGGRHGYFTPAERAEVIERVRASGARIVTVALGSPRQELFMRECRAAHPDALYVGVGGTFDVVAGTVKRAPALFRKAQLEWLYRIASQPTRWHRLERVVRYAAYHYGNRL